MSAWFNSNVLRPKSGLKKSNLVKPRATFSKIYLNIVYLLEHVYLLMIQNWTWEMHNQEEILKSVGYQKSLRKEKFWQEVEHLTSGENLHKYGLL